MRKKFITGLLIILSAGTLLLGLSACKKNSDKPQNPPEPEQPTSETPYIYLNKTHADAQAFTYLDLTAVKENTESEIVWKSSDEKIVTVQNGRVACYAQGTATITASVDEATAECEITVEKSDFAPVLFLSQNEVSVYENESYLLESKVKIGEMVFDNAAVQWLLAGGAIDSVAEISGEKGLYEITGKNAGCAEYYGVTEMNGISAYAKLNVNVVQPTISLEFKNILVTQEGYCAKVSMLKTEQDNDTFKVETSAINLGGTPINNGVLLTYSSQNENILTIDENGNITPVAKGKTSVKVHAEKDNIQSDTFITVEVYAPTIELNDTFTLETLDLKPIALTETLHGDIEKVTIEQNEEIYAKNVFGSLNERSLVLKDLPTQAKYLGENVILKIDTKKASYVLQGNIYTKVIKTKSDLDAISGKDGISDNCTEDLYDGCVKLFDGYFVFGSDINYNGTYSGLFGKINTYYEIPGRAYTYYSTYREGDYEQGFQGVIDGKGHYISGLKMTSNNGATWGFIPTIKRAGTLKNLAFIDAEVENSAYISACLAGTIENIYVKYKSIKMTTDNGWEQNVVTFAPATNAYSTIKTSFVDASEAKIDVSGVTKCILFADSMRVAATENCFCISANAVFSDDARQKYASFEALQNDASVQRIIAAYDQSVWTIKDGAPIFRTLLQ